MKSLIVFVIGAICGTAATAVVHYNHIVQTNDQWLVVPRVGATLKDCYADVRHWTLEDWRAHKELANDMVKAGHAEIMQTDNSHRVSEHEIDQTSEKPEIHRTAMQHTDRHRPERTQRRHDDFDPDSRPE